MRVSILIPAIAAVVAAVIALGAAPAEARTVSYAVIIGNNAPPSEPGTALRTLRYADDDAVRYYQLLSQFSRTTLLSTLDDATQKRNAKIAALARVPTLEAVRQVFASLGNDMRLDRDAGNEPVLYFVFSGHGALAESGEPYLALGDGRLTQRVLFDELIGSLPAPRTHVIVDACHAAGVVGARGIFDHEAEGKTAPVTDAEVLAIAKTNALTRYPNVGVIVATTLGNETHEWSAIEAGVFSHEVLSALSGPADVNGDRAIEYSELHAFIANANRSIANPRAVPIVVSLPPRANRREPIVRLSALKRSFVLQGDVRSWGRFSVELGDGRRIVDAHLSGERPVAVALPVGEPVFVRTAAGEARVTSAGGAVAVNDVRLARSTVASRGSVDADYRKNLFASAYGPTYYSGFVDSHGLVSVDFDLTFRVQGTVDVEPPATSRRWYARPRPWAYALLGTSVVSGTVAAYFGYSALKSWREFSAAQTRDGAYEPAGEYNHDTRVFWPTATVSVLAGVSSWYLFRRASLAVAPTIEPASGAPGVSVSGRW